MERSGTGTSGLRYWQNEKRRFPTHRIPIVFLTKVGYPPQRAEQIARDLVTLSYRDDIAPLLLRLIAEDRVKATRVRETLRQYVDLLEFMPSESEG
jgi:hypothetical protein